MKQECKEIENLKHKHAMFNMHKKIKEKVNLYQKKRSSVLTDQKHKTIIKEKELLNAWESYIAEVFRDDRGEKPEVNQCNEEGPEILKSQARLKTSKGRKMPRAGRNSGRTFKINKRRQHATPGEAD